MSSSHVNTRGVPVETAAGGYSAPRAEGFRLRHGGGLLNIDTWHLIINTATTIVTFLLVALLQNTQKRADDALQQKLNALADALADLSLSG